MGHEKDLRSSPSPSIERRMSKNAAHETRRFVLLDAKADQAIPPVAKTPVEVVGIPGEEGYRPMTVQQRNDCRVFHALLPDVQSDLTNRDAPTAEKLPLIVRQVFVQGNQAPTALRRMAGERATNVSRARFTASAIASLVMLPRHSSAIASHAIPLATCSSTSDTRTRVPRNVSFP